MLSSIYSPNNLPLLTEQHIPSVPHIDLRQHIIKTFDVLKAFRFKHRFQIIRRKEMCPEAIDIDKDIAEAIANLKEAAELYRNPGCRLKSTGFCHVQG